MTIKPDKIFAVVDEAGVAAYTQAILKGFGADKGILDVTGDIGSQFNYFGTAVAPYDHQSGDVAKDQDGNTYKRLMPVEDVLKILTIPDSRQKTYASEFATALIDNAYERADQQDVRGAAEIASGKSPHGFAVSVLRVAGLPAANEVRHATNIYVAEDQRENKVIVLGDQTISPSFKKALYDEGLEYLHYKDPAAAHQINTFFADGLKARMSKGGTFDAESIQDLMGGVIHSLSLQQETRDNGDESYLVPAGTTIGKFFVDVFKMQKHLGIDPEENATLMLRSTPKPTGKLKR